VANIALLHRHTCVAIQIRQLEPGDAARLFRLRRQALIEEPFAFLSSPEDDSISSPQATRSRLSSQSAGSAVFGALDGETLIGMVGLSRDRPLKAAHRACIWGVFVDKEYRRAGIASRLLNHVLDHARQVGLSLVYLSVSEKTPGAKRLYESAGFVVWGLEPDCMRHEGEPACEYHLSLSM